MHSALRIGFAFPGQRRVAAIEQGKRLRIAREGASAFDADNRDDGTDGLSLP